MKEREVVFEEIERSGNMPVSLVQEHITKVQDAYWDLEQRHEEALDILKGLADLSDETWDGPTEELEELALRAKKFLEQNDHEVE